MPFTSWPLAFAVEISNSVTAIWESLQPSACPPVLHHNTTYAGITGIIETRAVWATCIEDLEDKAEIQHGVEIVEAEIRQIHFSEDNSIPEQILRFVPDLLKDRKSWTFVACFRGNLERPAITDATAAKRCAEWEIGHPYGLEFDTLSDPQPRLRSGMFADVHYHRVIYDPALQRAAVARLITAVIASTQNNCAGTLEGPWAESLAKIQARIVSQCLIDMISAFKSPAYAWEDEWRVVCRPRITPAGSAPDLDDDNFRTNIKAGSSRYVELRTHEQGPVFNAFPPCVVPFRAVRISDPSNNLTTEHRRIRQVLEENGQQAIPVHVSSRAQRE